jgi:ribosomal protein S18 acetylase RimI-like enzyme
LADADSAREADDVANEWDELMRPATDADDAFLFDVYCTTKHDQVAALPNPRLAAHFLRIEYTAQNRRFTVRFPGYERWVVVVDGEPGGRLYLHRSPSLLQVVDITLLPEHRGQGLGRRLMGLVLDGASAHDQAVTLRVSRSNQRATGLYDAVGFRLVTEDDLDAYFEWSPGAERAAPPRITRGGC